MFIIILRTLFRWIARFSMTPTLPIYPGDLVFFSLLFRSFPVSGEASLFFGSRFPSSTSSVSRGWWISPVVCGSDLYFSTFFFYVQGACLREIHGRQDKLISYGQLISVKTNSYRQMMQATAWDYIWFLSKEDKFTQIRPTCWTYELPLMYNEVETVSIFHGNKKSLSCLKATWLFPISSDVPTAIHNMWNVFTGLRDWASLGVVILPTTVPLWSRTEAMWADLGISPVWGG